MWSSRSVLGTAAEMQKPHQSLKLSLPQLDLQLVLGPMTGGLIHAPRILLRVDINYLRQATSHQYNSISSLISYTPHSFGTTYIGFIFTRPIPTVTDKISISTTSAHTLTTVTTIPAY